MTASCPSPSRFDGGAASTGRLCWREEGGADAAALQGFQLRFFQTAQPLARNSSLPARVRTGTRVRSCGVATQDRDDVCGRLLLPYRCMYAGRLTVVRRSGYRAHSGQPSTLEDPFPVCTRISRAQPLARLASPVAYARKLVLLICFSAFKEFAVHTHAILRSYAPEVANSGLRRRPLCCTGPRLLSLGATRLA